MERHGFKGGRITEAAFDDRDKRLELRFANGETRIFAGVPTEVFRRLVAAPNPASYYEDRIAEEYPVRRGPSGTAPDARSKLDDLFGGGGDR